MIKDRTFVKSIILNRCDLCTIGMGTSKYYSNGEWKTYEHMFSRVYTIRANGRILQVDRFCYENIVNKRSRKKLKRD